MTETDITIPPGALEAAAFVVGGLRLSEKYTSEDIARAACLAMLKAWPGMDCQATDWDRWKLPFPLIILPLPAKEASNAP